MEWAVLAEAARVRFKGSAMARRRAISAAAALRAGRAVEGSEAVDALAGPREAAVGGADKDENAFHGVIETRRVN